VLKSLRLFVVMFSVIYSIIQFKNNYFSLYFNTITIDKSIIMRILGMKDYIRKRENESV